MNAPAFGYTNVVSLADTQRISGNMILSDFNKSGVAHAPKTTPVLAIAADYSAGRSAIRNAGAVALATASTQAPTVRQHGGGRARSTLRTQQPSGRPTRSTGGEINSLCCAAAGIIALASRPCGARAYPLTGVRRAAHPAAPLRSTPRPPAQLVKGGELSASQRVFPNILMQNLSMTLFNVLQSESCDLYFLCPARVMFRHEDTQHSSVYSMQSQHGVKLHEHPFRIQQKVPPRGIALHAGQRAEPAVERFDSCSEILLIVPLMANTAVAQLEFIKKLFNFKTHLETHQSKLMILSHRILALFFENHLPLASRDPNGNRNANERTNCLHPTSSRITSFDCKHHNVNQSKHHDSAWDCCMALQPLPYKVAKHLLPLACCFQELEANSKRSPGPASGNELI